MNGSTEMKQHTMLSTWQFKFFVACVLTALVIVLRTFHLVQFSAGQQIYLSMMRNLAAPIEAGRITVANGISDFSGSPLAIVGWSPYLKVLFAIWFTFVVMPTGWIVLRINREERNASGLPIPSWMRIGTGLTAVWVIVFTLSIVGTLFAARSVYSTMQQDNNLSRYRNDVTDHLSMISYTAQQYYILPSPDGNDGDSFTKMNTPVSLPGLGFKETTELGRTVLYGGGNDTTLHLLFIGNRMSEFDCADPAIGDVVQYEVMITPQRYRISMKQ